MHIIIAPNAFKGSLTSEQAAERIAAGLKKSKLSCTLKLIPIADGGDGTAHLISGKLSAKTLHTVVRDPLGNKISASYGWDKKNKTAIIEMADASGIRLLKKEALNPLKSNTRGAGELIKAALDRGAKKIVIGLGGSATVDGATGLLNELGVQFLDRLGRKLTELPKGLLALNRIDVSGLDKRVKDCSIILLCDVTNKLLGNNGAATVFGPQKGANKNEVALLEKCLYQFNKIVKKDLMIDMNSFKYGGAAGGVAAAMAAFTGAKLVSGISYYLNIVSFDDELKNTNLVITGEGALDAQTLEGKGPFGVAERAIQHHIPVIVLAGQTSSKIEKELHQYFDAVFSIGHGPATTAEAISNTASDLERTAFELGNLLALKNNLSGLKYRSL